MNVTDSDITFPKNIMNETEMMENEAMDSPVLEYVIISESEISVPLGESILNEPRNADGYF